MKKLSLIIKREFISKVRNKSFIVMTFLSPLLFVCIAVLVGYLSTMEKENASSIAIHDASGVFVKQFKNKKNIRYIDLSFLPFKIAKDTAAKSYDGLLYIPSVDSLQQLKSKVEYISEESPSLNFVSEVEQIVDSILTSDKLNALGFDSKKIEDSRVSSSLKLSKFSGGETVKGLNEIKLFIGGAFGYLIMMFIVIYGNFVMRSVIEEKTNRIIEIIISSVKPFQLMMGKIIGNALAGLLQFVIWAIMGGVLFFIFSYLFGFQLGASVVSTDTIHHIQPDMLSTIKIYISEILTLPLGTLFISFLLYFAGGYFLYSSFYAAIGAAVDSETDSQQF
ncbi:MAG TPA: ABC transporter permease, partial [Flavobacterium sp.]|nr:ABC transporter permease [Flavobacterium sp.]